jgi:hypothetical protein
MRTVRARRPASDAGGRRIERVLRAMTPPHVWKEARQAMRKAVQGRK